MSPTKQDDETAKDSITPDFLKGIDISPEEEKQMENAAYSGAAADIAAREGLSGPDLKSAEESPETGPAKSTVDPKEGYRAGFGYRNEDKSKKSKKKGSFLKRNQKWFIGGGIGSGIAGLILSFMLLLPLKVQHIVNNLQSHFFASSEQATQGMTDKLFTQYIVKKVIPGMYASNKCTTTRASKSCAAITPGDGPIAQLYNAWRDKNFEGKLAENQGLEIRREGNKFFVRAGNSDLFSGVYDEKNPKLFEGKMYSEMNRTDARREIRKAFENETFAKRVMYKYKVGHLLEKKYGVRRCLVACTLRDKRADRKELRKLKWKAYFIDRIVTPRNEMLGIAMKCAIGGFDCTKADPAEADGERTSEVERETRTRIAELNTRGEIDSPEKVASLEEDARNIEQKGLTGHIIEKLTNETVSKFAVKGIPVLGWIDTASRIVNGLKDAGPGLKKLNYVINSQTFVTMYMMYRTNADEIKTGEADAADIGIVANSLGPNNGTDQGGVGAEESPIYQEVMGSSSVKAASIFRAFVPKTDALAGYKCNDKSTIATGVCPEVTLNAISGIAKGAEGVSAIANSTAMAPIGAAASAWSATGGKIFDLASKITGSAIGPVMGFIEKLPGFKQLTDFGTEIAASIGKWFIGKALNDPLGDSPSGGRNMEMAAGGADVAGNSYAHYGIGGHRISDAAAAQIRVAMEQQEKEDFAHQSTFARMFDTSSQYSLVSKIAIALPSTTTSGTIQSMASALFNPFNIATTTFSTHSNAQAAPLKDAYGVTQYGYDANDPVLQTTTDLQNYWDTHDCSNPDRAKQWGDAEAKNLNPDTWMPENDITNGCALIATGVQMSGAMFDDSLLPPDELGSESISNPTNTGTGTATTLPANCYTVTKQKGSITEGKMLHKEPGLAIDTYAKENSPQGIKYAAANGYDSIDLDIQITKDGVPINTHWGQPMLKDGFYDPLHKLPDGTQVSDMTLDEVTRLRNHDGQSRIYSLEDQIKVLAANHVNLSLEIKTAALVKTYPQITGWLNQAAVKAYIKGDASRPALDNGLTAARNYGYWTRGTLGTQDWKAPGPNCVQ